MWPQGWRFWWGVGAGPITGAVSFEENVICLCVLLAGTFMGEGVEVAVEAVNTDDARCVIWYFCLSLFLRSFFDL